MVINRFHGNLVTMGLLAALITQTALAKSAARVPRTTTGINDSLSITFETDQSVSTPPDFSALADDFEVLGTSKSTRVNIINGSMQRSAQWILDVLPKREGTLVIPPVTIGNETTEAVSITVTARSSNPTDSFSGEINLEVDVDNLSPYVQGQLIFTVRIVHNVSFDQASLTEPSVTGGDAIIEKLGDDVAYETQRGQDRVAIIERRYAMFPQTSEPMTIAPLRFEGRIADGGQARFDPFARGRVARRQTDTIEINTRPIPTTFSGTTWLPAHQLMLVETSSETDVEYRVGEPFTRALTLQATGLSASQLPEIRAPIPDTIKQYPDQPVLENQVSADDIVGIRQEKIALIPSQPGMVTLPAIKIPWWNTATDQMEYATLPARTIEVAPALGGNASMPPQTAAEPGTVDGDVGNDNIQSGDTDGATTLLQAAGSSGIWPWVSLALAICWLATLFVWLRGRQQPPDEAGSGKAPVSEKQLLRDLQAACEAHDAGTAKTTLLQWASLQWPGNRINSLGDLAAQFDGQLQRELHRLSQHLYAGNGGEWNGSHLWQSFAARPTSSATTTAQRAELEPLYR